MVEVFASLGSNQNREHNIRSAVYMLGKIYGRLVLSPVYLNAAVGFEGEDFLNMVVHFSSDLPPQAIQDEFHGIEKQHGRQRGQNPFSPRPLDIDLILYGNSIIREAGFEIPRRDIEMHRFVLKPLMDIAPTHRHPVTGLTYRKMWDQAGDDETLHAVALEFDTGEPYPSGLVPGFSGFTDNTG